MPWAWTPTSRRVPRVGGHRRAEQRVDLLRRRARDRRRLVLGVARRDRDLGAAAALAVAHALGDVRGERLGLEAPRRARPRRSPRSRPPRSATCARPSARARGRRSTRARRRRAARAPFALDPDDLLDAGHAHAREADARGRPAGLDVVAEKRGSLGHCARQRYLQAPWGKSHERVYTGRGCDAARCIWPNWLSPSRQTPRSSTTESLPQGRHWVGAVYGSKERGVDGGEARGSSAAGGGESRRRSSRSRSCARSWPRARSAAT